MAESVSGRHEGLSFKPTVGEGQKSSSCVCPSPTRGQGDLGAKAPAVGCPCVGETLLSGWWAGEVHSGLGVPAGNECSGCAWSPLRTALQGRPPTSPHGCLMST